MRVPVDSSMPGGKAGVLTPSVWMEQGVVGTVGFESKSTSRVFNHWDVFSTGCSSSAEFGRSDTEYDDEEKKKNQRNE